jgi:hypothetical protein
VGAGTNTHAQLDSHLADATNHFTEASIVHANIVGAGTNTHAQLDTHVADATKHFSEASIVHANIVGSGTNTHAQIDIHVADDTKHFTEASIDHVNILNKGTNTHAQLDIHVADDTKHFTEASIVHANIVGAGTNTHAQIDTHVADTTKHFTEASIVHANIVGVGTNTHAQLDTHVADTTKHFTEASIIHANIVGVGTNTHAQLDTHVADDTKHFTEASIVHANILGAGTNTHAQLDSHLADATKHFTEASIDHFNILNKGTNTHAQLDTHVADATKHFTEASIVHANIVGAGTNTHAQLDSHVADATLHRIINDGGTSSTELWSSDKITSELGSKSTTGHVHASYDVGLGNVLNLKQKVDGTVAPVATNDSGEGYEIGSRWMDIVADLEYVCTEKTVGAAVWKLCTVTETMFIPVQGKEMRTGGLGAVGHGTSPLTALSVAWSPTLGLFAGGDTNGAIHTSPDGETWTLRTTPASGDIRAIAWGNGMFCAAPTTENVITSTDGISWVSQVASPTGSYFWRMVFSPDLNLFCATGFIGSQMMTSPDGVTWTEQTVTDATLLSGIAWSSSLNLFCAVSKDGTTRVKTSPDGITWTNRNASQANQWLDVAWSEDLSIFCACSSNGVDRIMTSPDGITWTSRTMTSPVASSIVWVPEWTLFVVAGEDEFRTSVDGINWSTASDLQYRTNCSQLVWSPELSLLVGSQSESLVVPFFSFGQVPTWSEVAAPVANSWQDVAWSESLGLFAAVSTNGTNDQVMTSPDGVVWTSRSNPNNSSWQAIEWGEGAGVFCAVSSNANVMTSPDGITWTTRTASSHRSWEDIAWSSDLSIFCAVCRSGAASGRVMTSPDGINWTGRTAASDSGWEGVAWSSNLTLFVAVATDGTNRFMTSPNGITWTIRSSTIGNLIRNTGVAWNSSLGLFVSVASNSSSGRSMMSSPDGINWSPLNTGTDAMSWITATTKGFRASGSNNYVHTSTDGVNWERQLITGGSAGTMRKLAYAPSIDITAIMCSGAVQHTSIAAGTPLRAELIQLPSVTTVQQQSVTAGSLAFNPTTSNMSFYNGVSWEEPVTAVHSHVIADTTGLQAALDLKETIVNTDAHKNDDTLHRIINDAGLATTDLWSAEKITTELGNKSDTGHSHVIGDTTGLQATLDLKETIVNTDAHKNDATLHRVINDSGTSATDLLSASKIYTELSALAGVTNTYDANSAPGVTEDANAGYAPGSKILHVTNGEMYVCTDSTVGSAEWKLVTQTESKTRSGLLKTTWSFRRTQNNVGVGNEYFYDVVWSEELNIGVAVGNQTIMTTTDGDSWVNSFTPTNGNVIRAIEWISDLGLFVALNADGTTTNQSLWSSDGLNWTEGTTIAATETWNDIQYGDASVPVLVGIAQLSDPMHSTDGKTWTASGSLPSAVWTGLTYSPALSMFVAVAGNGSGQRIATSTDGINWTGRTVAFTEQWQDVAWSPSLSIFCAVGSSGSNRVMTSPDGIAWTERTAPYMTTWKSIEWNPDDSVFAAVSSNAVMTSSDGINWVHFVIQGQCTAVSWVTSLNRFIAVGNSHDAFGSIEQTYTLSESASTGAVGVTPIWSPKLNLYVMCYYQNILTSSDGGVTWVLRVDDSGTSNSWQGGVWSPELEMFCIVAHGGSSRLRTSLDGINWDEVAGTNTRKFQTIAWSPSLGIFCAPDYNNTQVYLSSDGVTWNAETAFTGNWNRMVWAEGVGFVTTATSGTNQSMASADGVSWTLGTISANQHRSLAWGAAASLFVAVASNGTKRITTSPDGLNWTELEIVTAAWDYVSWSDELGVFLANSASNIAISTNGVFWTVFNQPGTQGFTRSLWNPTLSEFLLIGTGKIARTTVDTAGVRKIVSLTPSFTSNERSNLIAEEGVTVYNSTTKSLNVFSDSKWFDSSVFDLGIQLVDDTVNTVGIAASDSTTSYKLTFPPTLGSGALTDSLGTGTLSWAPSPVVSSSVFLKFNGASGGIIESSKYDADSTLYTVSTNSTGAVAGVANNISLATDRISVGRYDLFVRTQIASFTSVSIVSVSTQSVDQVVSFESSNLSIALPYDVSTKAVRFSVRNTSGVGVDSNIICEVKFSQSGISAISQI